MSPKYTIVSRQMSYNKITFDNHSKNNVIIKVLEALTEKGFILEGVEN